jgi:hypothetical protein
LVWVKNTGSRFLWLYHIPPDCTADPPLAGDTKYTVVAAGKSVVIYARTDGALLYADATLPGFLGANAHNDGSQEYLTTMDVVALGLDSFWAAGDQQP